MSRGTTVRLLLLAGIWGSSFLLIKIALEGLAPAQVVLWRLVAGSAVLLAAVLVQRRALPREPALLGHLALMGVIANVIPFFLFAWGETRITSGLAGVLNGATPLFTLGFAVAALPEERLSAARATGLALGFAGVVVVVGPWDANPLTSSIPGQLACLGAALLYGAAFVYTRRFISGRGQPVLVLSAVQLGIATLVMLLLAPWVASGPVQATPAVVLAVAALGAVGTGLAYLLYYRLVTDAGATTASMVTYLIPLVSVALGAVLLGEPVGWNVFVGAAVVIIGVALAEGRLDRWSPLPPARPTVDAPPLERTAAGAP